jgi:hypothetical protein
VVAFKARGEDAAEKQITWTQKESVNWNDRAKVCGEEE